MKTIYALSSGAPPAGIGVIRVTGPRAGAALEALAGPLPPARRASRRRIRDRQGATLDDAMVLWFPGPGTVTGEDVAEIHAHGGRAVLSAIEAALAALPGLHHAEPGEFTRRAFVNGRIDLAEAEGLADLLAAETELQRQAAMANAGGLLSRKVEGWRERLLLLSAEVEAALDFDEEDGIAELPPQFHADLQSLGDEITSSLLAPSAEALREGFRVAIAGPPNAGKSTLFNALVDSEAAITSPIAGTTRDVIVRSVALTGVPFSFVDMAGIHTAADDPIETIGISRAEAEITRADLVLWLGPEGAGPRDAWEVSAQEDRLDRPPRESPDFRLSALTGFGMSRLREALVAKAQASLAKPREAALNRRQRTLLSAAASSLHDADEKADLLILAEALRQGRAAFDALLGRTSTEEVLDTLFSRFCIGK